MSKADDIRKRMERDKERLVSVSANEAIEREGVKLIKAIGTKTVRAIVKRIGKAVALTINPDGEVILRTGAVGDKSPSMGRAAGVTGWIVNGKDIGSPLTSRMLAAVWKVDRPKDVYGGDSPERFARKTATLERIKAAKVQVVIDGKKKDAVTFLKS